MPVTYVGPQSALDEALAEALATTNALPEGARASFYAVEGTVGTQYLFLQPTVTPNTYRDRYLGWVVVADRDAEVLFGFTIGGAACTKGDYGECMREVAGRIECYFKTGLPAASTLTEGGLLPAPGEVAIRFPEVDDALAHIRGGNRQNAAGAWEPYVEEV